jgi:NADH dehydrogenase
MERGPFLAGPAAGLLAAARPRVVIIGGGFAGLSAAKALAGADLQVTLLDRANHHTFQPLLYQVATAVLAPSEIASPIREPDRRIPRMDIEGAHLLAGQLPLKCGPPGTRPP